MWRKRFEAVKDMKEKWNKKNALGSQICLASPREERTVQYLSALTEKQQWQQSLQLILIQENKLNKFPFLK